MHARHVEEDYQNTVASGGRGTPWSIVVSKSGKTHPRSGAQPYAAVKQLVDLALLTQVWATLWPLTLPTGIVYSIRLHREAAFLLRQLAAEHATCASRTARLIPFIW